MAVVKCISRSFCFLIALVTLAESSLNMLKPKPIFQDHKKVDENDKPAAMVYSNDPNYIGHLDTNREDFVLNTKTVSHALLRALFKKLYKNKNNLSDKFQKNDKKDKSILNILRQKTEKPIENQLIDLKTLRTALNLRQETECRQQNACREDCARIIGVEMQECIIQCTITFECGPKGVLPPEDEDNCGGEDNECGCKKKPNPSTRAPRDLDPNASWSMCC